MKTRIRRLHGGLTQFIEWLELSLPPAEELLVPEDDQVSLSVIDQTIDAIKR